jgi:hypothetical protein
VNVKYKLVYQNITTEKPDNSSVTIISDETAFLFTGKKDTTTHQYRVIKAMIDDSKEEICFVSNLLEEEAYIIADCYKQRWGI